MSRWCAGPFCWAVGCRQEYRHSTLKACATSFQARHFRIHMVNSSPGQSTGQQRTLGSYKCLIALLAIRPGVPEFIDFFRLPGDNRT